MDFICRGHLSFRKTHEHSARYPVFRDRSASPGRFLFRRGLVGVTAEGMDLYGHPLIVSTWIRKIS